MRTEHIFVILSCFAWEERCNTSAFHMFVRFALVWFCLFPLPRGVWEGLRFVIVALPGLLSYLFLELRARFRAIKLVPSP